MLATIGGWRWRHISARAWRVGPGWGFGPRRLEDVFVFLPVAGAARVTLGADGAPRELGVGRVLVLGERVVHAATLAPGRRRFAVHALHGLLHHADGRPRRAAFTDHILRLPDARAWDRRLGAVCALEARDPVAAAALVPALVTTLFADLIAVGARPADESPVIDPRVTPALDVLHADPAADHAIPHLAAVCGLRPVRFREVFRAATGRAPKAYQTMLRLRRAAEMLAGGDDSVAAVAAAVGYADSRWFARHFRSRYGCLPSAYRVRSRRDA